MAYIRGVAGLISTLFVCSILGFGQAPPSITTFSVPTSPSGPSGITAGPDGALWFTEFTANKIGRITTSGTVSEYTIPTTSSSSTAIVAGPDGALWFTENASNKIGRVTTAGAFIEYSIPTPASRTGSICQGPDGALWFTENASNKIGRVTTAGVFIEYLIPTAASAPSGITAGPDGALWFAEASSNKIGRITIDGSFQEYSVSAQSSPVGITPGPDGALWFTELTGNKIGRITTSGILSEFKVPTAFSSPFSITDGPDGALWFSEIDANNIARITTAGLANEYPVASFTSSIITGPDKALWFTESSANKIGRAQVCIPTTLIVTPSNAGAVLTSGIPIALIAKVVDDCGDPLNTGTVIASFSNGDPPVLLASQANGQWGGTWVPGNVQSQAEVTVTFVAQSAQGNAQIKGQGAITVTVTSTASGGVPLITTVTDGASFQANTLSPGSFVTVFGTNLAQSLSKASSLPLPTIIGGASVLVGSSLIPILYTSPTQINAILPYSLPVNAQMSVIVVNGSNLSLPTKISTAVANPGIFTYLNNQGVVVNGETNALISVSNPAARGSVIVIYCSGLGATNPPVIAGTASPVSLTTTTNTVSVTTGGVDAAVMFSGLTPGFAGLYQVNALVPSGAPVGDQVPLVVTVAGIASVPVNMAVN